MTHTAARSYSFTGKIGRISKITGPTLHVSGLGKHAALGDRIRIYNPDNSTVQGHIIGLEKNHSIIFCDQPTTGLCLDQRVRHLPRLRIFPCDGWLGRIIDPYGTALDGQDLPQGTIAFDVANTPPAMRRGLGARLNTGLCAFNTVLPLVRGQRIGIFAGSGVGKSTLLGQMTKALEADVIVVALIGERGREVREFANDVLNMGENRNCIIIAATSDKPATHRFQAAFTAMRVAEYFRDQGKNVAFFADSITRLAEAHREIAAHSGELPILRGYPPSLSEKITSLCERAGPGSGSQGDITAIFSVLVAGSDMDEPVADIIRGVLDGHIVLDRTIAERGRFPAVDLTRSVSRSLPHAATQDENALIAKARRMVATYEQAKSLIRAGFYTPGNDPELDHAVHYFPEIDAFLGQLETGSITDSFQKLTLIFRRQPPQPAAKSTMR